MPKYTITIDADTVHKAKIAAAVKGVPLGQLLNEAVVLGVEQTRRVPESARARG